MDPLARADATLSTSSSQSSLLSDPEQQPLLGPRSRSASVDLSPYDRRKYALMGVLLAFMSGLIFTFNNYLIKAFNVHFVDLLLMRGLIQLVVTSYLISIRRELFFWPWLAPIKTRIGIVVQAIVASVMITGGLVAVLLIPLGDFITLVFCTPLFTVVLERVFLGIRMTVTKVVLVLVLLVGVVLSVNPPFLPSFLRSKQSGSHQIHEEEERSWDYFLGCFIALSSACLAGVNSVILSTKALKKIRSTILFFHISWASLIVALVARAFQFPSLLLNPSVFYINAETWLVLMVLATFAISAYFMVVKALKCVEPSVVSVIRAMEVPMAFAVQILWMNEVPGLTSIIGTTLIVFSVLFIALERIWVGQARRIASQDEEQHQNSSINAPNNSAQPA